MKLLGVPKLANGTGEAEATAVFNLVQEWNLADRIKFMSFDTTATNTGPMLELVYAGACVLLEKKMGKDLKSRAGRRLHWVGGGAPVNFGRRRRAAGPKKSAAARRGAELAAKNSFFLRFTKKCRSILKIFLGTFSVIKALRFADDQC